MLVYILILGTLDFDLNTDNELKFCFVIIFHLSGCFLKLIKYNEKCFLGI
jgi:hypothetical protein